MTQSLLLRYAFVWLGLVVLLPGVLVGQELIVEPTASEGPYLNEIIAGDTTSTGERLDENRVYVLRRDGIYLVNDDIRAIGFSLRMMTEDGAGARAIIYPVTNTETGGFPDPIVDMQGDVWIKSVVMTGYTDAIPEEVANINSTIIRPNAPGFDLTLDDVVMSNTRGQHIRTQAAARNVVITNTIFANMGDLGRSNFGAGKAIDLRDGSVELLKMQNCTFVNFQDRIIRHRSSTAPINHLVFDHNTIINGMSYHGTIALGWMGDDAEITNNLFLDHYVAGSDLNDESRQAEYDEHGETFGNGKPSMPWIFSVPNDSTEWTVANNFYAVSAAVQTFYDTYAAAGVQGVGEALTEHIASKVGGTPFQAVDLEVANRPDVMIDMAVWYREETGLTKETGTFVREDDDFDRRPVTYFTDEFDASYPTDNPAYSGGENGFPAGDLNWFPAKKAEWESGSSVELVPLVVEPTDGVNGPFLNEVIAGDTTSTGDRAEMGRVYVLRRDGIYLTNDDIRAVGFPLRMMTEDGAGARAIIYPVTNTETGGFPDPIVDMQGDVWIKSVVMTGYTDAIPEEVANINSTIIRPNAPGYDLILDDVVMSNTRGQHIRTQAAARNVKITNSIFANMGDLGRSNFGAGKAIDLRDGSVDTLLMQNNTFVNFQDRIIRHRSSTAPINHLIFDHNSVINGMSYHGTIALGWMGADAVITNNLFLDHYVAGADLNDESRQAEYDEHGETFGNGKPSMPWIFSVPNDSTLWTVSNNYYATSQAVNDFYAAYANEGVLGVGEPVTDHIRGRVGKTADALFEEVELEVANRPDVMINMATWYRTETGLTKETGTFVREDDDFDRRPVTYFTEEFDASYPTDNPAYTGAVKGFPVGDLNWFPEKKQEWIATPIEHDPVTDVPIAFELEQNYPNPFNPTTHISYRLPEAAKVSLSVYNILGARVAQLVDNVSQTAGRYTVTWNGTDGGGAGVASGVYLYQLRTENSVITKSMILLK